MKILPLAVAAVCSLFTAVSPVFGADFVLSSSPGVGAQPYAVTAADVNGDGKIDLISANSSNLANTLSVLTNNGSGGFVLSSSLVVNNVPVSVAAADVNNDGK